ncbi:MAG: tRNA epoxyqueuosine(34) reductase QueG [Gemmatimonadetes bacterium]|nr:tRNA epoxyqueuosine(34) reductase QueG [Gemmatimonadota bacterium]
MGNDSTERAGGAPATIASAERSRVLKELALSEGFQLSAICAPHPSEHTPFLEQWLAEGRHGEMAYLARADALARRADLRLTFAEVKAVLCVAEGYHLPDPEGVPADPSRGVIARYARGENYHRVVEKRLRHVHRRFEEGLGEPVPARAYVDTGPILERELARRAGLGWFGRNTMLIHPREGSYFFLGILLLGIELEPDPPFVKDHCGSCRACLDACPTGALLGRDESGAPVMDAPRCISYLTIEHRGAIPGELRPLIGNRIFGCDICQEVCPFNGRFVRDATDPAYAARTPEDLPGTNGPPLLALMAMDRAAWERFSKGSPIRRAGYAGFRRNVAVALGNWGAPEAVPALSSAMTDPDPLVRGHAAWALGQVGSQEALATLESRRSVESDPFSRSEIEAALEGV